MLKSKDLEIQLVELNNKISELEIRNAALDANDEAFLEELKVTPEQLTALVTDSSAFTEDNWKQLQAEKQRLDAALEKELNSLSKPLETRKKYEQNGQIQNHWLFVR